MCGCDSSTVQAISDGPLLAMEINGDILEEKNRPDQIDFDINWR